MIRHDACHLVALGLRLSLAAVFALLAACHALGPQTVARDRFEYSTAIGDSWKRQTLLNVVKLRYLDPPIFVDVGQIISAYSMESTVNLGGTFAGVGDTSSVGAEGKFTDRPTVTYVPLTGSRFISSLITPLPPESLLLTIQSGWAADVMFTLGVAAINGIHNGALGVGGYQASDPRFGRVVQLLRSIQLADSVAIAVEKAEDGRPSTLISFHAPGTSTETLANIRELRTLLGLDQEASEFELVHSDVATNDRQIALRSRSLLHAITALSTRVAVPERDIAEGRAFAGDLATAADGGFRVLSSETEPDDAFVAVAYRDHWFYIDDRDLVSKRAFGFVMLLFTLADAGTQGGGAVLTIPAQ